MTTKWIYLFAVLIALDCNSPSAEACSCMREHPQTHFCRSDFAVVARVKRLVKSDPNSNSVYRVVVRRQFKASEKARVAFKSAKIYTPPDDGVCGVDLQVNQTYLLTGNIYHLQPHVNVCNYAVPWRNVTPRQRKGFRLLYKQGCDCKITSSFGRRSHSAGVKHSCTWANPMRADDCFSPYGICLINRMGKCSWANSPMLTKCLRRGKLSKMSTTPARYIQT